MFTGIIEEMAEVVALEKEGSNVKFSLSSKITNELKVDQSLAHDGVCLTVVDIIGSIYKVTAIKETLDKSNLGFLDIGSKVNIERSMKMGERIDGHMVQGHIDQIAICTQVKKEDGSYIYTFEYEPSNNMTVEKGSICVNGVSLTVINSKTNSFSTAIIPYTFEHTNLNIVKLGSVVNIEFDILGKYISKLVGKEL